MFLFTYNLCVLYIIIMLLSHNLLDLEMFCSIATQVLSLITLLLQYIISHFKPHPQITLNGMLLHRKSRNE